MNILTSTVLLEVFQQGGPATYRLSDEDQTMITSDFQDGKAVFQREDFFKLCQRQQDWIESDTAFGLGTGRQIERVDGIKDGASSARWGGSATVASLNNCESIAPKGQGLF